MKVVSRPDRLELSTEVPWWSRMIGIPILVLAILCSWSWLTGGVTDGTGQKDNSAATLLLIAPLALAGLVFGFGQVKLILDLSTHRVTRWVGAVLPFWRRSLSLSELEKVTIKTVRSSHEGRTHKDYAVHLMGPGGQLSSSAIGCEYECRRLARRAAVFTGLPLYDTLKGATIPSSQLQGNLRERLNRNPAIEVSEVPPHGVRSDLEDGCLKVVLEPPGMTFATSLLCYVQIGFLSLFMLPLAYAGFTALSQPNKRTLALPVFCLVGILMLVAWGIHRRTRRQNESVEQFELTDTAFSWRQSWRGRTDSKTIRIEDIDDLDTSLTGLLLLTSSDLHRMAVGAGQEQRDWMEGVFKGRIRVRH